MADQPIGNLSATITANAQQLIDEFRRAQQAIDQNTNALAGNAAGITAAGEKLEKGAVKIGLGMLGARTAAGLVIREIKDVISNIDNIPGIPAATISSIKEMESSLHGARNAVSGWIAGALAGFNTLSQSVGAGMAMLLNAMTGTKDDFSGLSKQQTPDEVALQKDANFHDKVRASVERLNEARSKAAIAAMTEGDQVKALLEKAQRYETFSQSSSINTVQRLDAQTKAFELTREAESKLTSLRKQSGDAARVYNDAQKQLDEVPMSLRERADLLKANIDSEKTALAVTRARMELDPEDAANLERRILLFKELTHDTQQYTSVVEKLKEPFQRLRDTAVSALQGIGDEIASMIVDGKANFADFARTVEKEVLSMALKLAIINPLLNGIFGLTGKFALPVLAGFASGGEPPVGVPSIVGEDGPELFVPKEAGMIVPASVTKGLASATGSSRGGNTYNIDARGADIGVEDRLNRALLQLAGPGVTERRSVMANQGARNRRLVPA